VVDLMWAVRSGELYERNGNVPYWKGRKVHKVARRKEVLSLAWSMVLFLFTDSATWGPYNLHNMCSSTVSSVSPWRFMGWFVILGFLSRGALR
jgi:hypothetical protein